MKDKIEPLTGSQMSEIVKSVMSALGVPTKRDAQLMLEQPYLSSRLREVFDQAACYPREQDIAKVGYPDDYTGPLPLREQINMLAERFSLDPSRAISAMYDTGDKHARAEGWFAVVNWKVLGDDYLEQCWKVFDWIRERSMSVPNPQRGFGSQGMFSYTLMGGLDEAQIGFHTAYNRWRSSHCQTDDDPIWIFPAQFGLGRAGQSHRRAVELCKRTKTEFPLSIFEVACMIAVHPMRLGKGGFSNELHAICPGSVEVPKSNATYHEGLDRRHFGFYGDGAKTVSDYNRHCSFTSSTGGSYQNFGPVTAWTWQKQER
jgi:hypothetical protein